MGSPVYQQCQGYLMGSPVSPIVSHLHMEIFQHLTLLTYLYAGLRSWHRYVDDAFVTTLKNSLVQGWPTYGTSFRRKRKNFPTFFAQLNRISSLPR